MIIISSRKKYLFIISLCILLAGCSWFGESAEPENASYEAGKKALSEGRFEEAKSHLRDITPDSPFYPQAVWMIQKVPFKKGVSAYEQKRFEVAFVEFSKVPLHAADYAESQRYLNLINYKKIYDQLKATSKAAAQPNSNSDKDAEEYISELSKCLNFHDLILKKFKSLENQSSLVKIIGTTNKNPIVFSNTRNCNEDYVDYYFEKLSEKVGHPKKDVEEIVFNYDIVLITKLVNLAEKLADSEKISESFNLVKSGIKQSSTNRETEDFLMLLEKIVSRNKNQEINENALNFLLTDFGKLYKRSAIRPQVA